MFMTFYSIVYNKTETYEIIVFVYLGNGCNFCNVDE